MRDLPPTVDRLVASILDQFPVHRGFLEQALDGATAEELDRLGRYLDFCIGKGLTPDYLAESYLTILGDTLDEQLYFREHDHYRHSSFADVAESVYHDRDYMVLRLTTTRSGLLDRAVESADSSSARRIALR